MRYNVVLSQSEIEYLERIIHKGIHPSQSFRAALILLNCNKGVHAENVTNSQISSFLRIGMRTIDRVKKKYLTEGVESVLERRKHFKSTENQSNVNAVSRLLKLCAEDPPEGCSRWSYRLLAGKMVELKYAKSISHVTVGNILKKANIKLK